jgi:hypothetical protein
MFGGDLDDAFAKRIVDAVLAGYGRPDKRTKRKEKK